MSMRRMPRAVAVGFASLFIESQAIAAADSESYLSGGGAAGFAVVEGSPFEKSALAQSFGSRGTVTPTATLYGGFALGSTAVVYFLIRGNSLGTLGVTQAYLDLPRVRIYNSQGQDIVLDLSGNVGFNSCLGSNTFAAPVRNYYTFTRGQPPTDRDACTSGTLGPGVYTFSVTPAIPGVTTANPVLLSTPSSGEVLFEITLNP